MTDLMPMVRAERQTLSEFLDTLTPEQWAAPTVCDRWNVQDLVAHLVAAGHVTAPHFFVGLVRHGFSFDRFVENDVRTFNTGTTSEVKARFDQTVNSTRKPPGPAYVALGEVMVHGEDIRNAVGVRGQYSPEYLVTLADMYKRAGAPLRAKQRLKGLRLQATDVDWSTGEGPEMSGPCMSLIQAMTGRRSALADCTGEGVKALKARS